MGGKGFFFFFFLPTIMMRQGVVVSWRDFPLYVVFSLPPPVAGCQMAGNTWVGRRFKGPPQLARDLHR